VQEPDKIVSHFEGVSVSVEQKRKTVKNTVFSFDSNNYTEFMTNVDLMPGVTVGLVEIPQDEEYKTSFTVGKAPVEFLFCLKGESRAIIKHKSGDKPLNISEGEYLVTHIPNVSGNSLKKPDHELFIMNIFIDPEILRNLLENSSPSDLAIDLSDKKRELFLRIRKISKTVMVSINEVISLIKAESANKLLLSAKICELITYVCTDMASDSENRKSVLQPEDVNKILNAANILTGDIAKPPSVKQLSHRVALNEFKLKSGFKEVFSTTIYGYIRQERMEKAKKMLCEGSFSVSEVAWDIGYTNVSHFISLFHKTYGVNPGKYLSEIRNTLTNKYIDLP